MACPGGKQRITLNSADRIYAELRDRSFAAVGPELRRRAMAIQSDYKTSKVADLPAVLADMPQACSRLSVLLRPVLVVCSRCASALGLTPEWLKGRMNPRH